MTDAVELAADIAERVLFPTSIATDRADLVPRSNLDALADAGLYGLFGPVESGGLAVDLATACEVVEVLASGCVNTTLTWLQHHRSVLSLSLSSDPSHHARLAELCTGRYRSGVVFAGLVPGPATLHAAPSEAHGDRDGFWHLTGTAPWVSGWGNIDTLFVTARGPEDTVVSFVLDDLDRYHLGVRRHRMVALDATGTVELTFQDVRVTPDHLVSVAPHDSGGSGGRSLRLNGSLALGVVRRCCTLLGPSTLDDELDAVRAQLDEADDDTMAAARAAASACALHAATRLVAATGSRAIDRDQQAQLLARNALALLVFGFRPEIKQALLDQL